MGTPGDHKRVELSKAGRGGISVVTERQQCILDRGAVYPNGEGEG